MGAPTPSASPLRTVVTVLLAPVQFLFGPLTRENLRGWIGVIGLVLVIWWVGIQPFQVPSGSMEPTLRGDDHFFENDRVLVNKHRYGIRVPFMNELLWRGADPQRWDIVVFNNPEHDPRYKILVKRIVGLPGERIHIAAGKVYVNGKPLTLPEGMPDVRYSRRPAPPEQEVDRILEQIPPAHRAEVKQQIFEQYDRVPDPTFSYGVREEDEYAVVPEGHYLMLGDNTGHSRDGRVFGWAPRENLLGPVFCIWWPFGHARDFTGFSKTWWGRLFLYGIPALFVLYEVVSASLLRSWRIAESTSLDAFRRGDHVLVNRLAFGFRLPFVNLRVTRGRSPRRSEWVFYYGPGERAEGKTLCLGRVIGLPGDATPGANGQPRVPQGSYIIASGDHVDASDPATHSIAHNALLGAVLAIWRPFRRFRRFVPDAGAEADASR